MRKVHICAGLFLGGLLLMIGKAGACDLGAPLAETVPGALLGLAMMAAGAYGLWLADLQREEGKRHEQAAAAARGYKANHNCKGTRNKSTRT